MRCALTLRDGRIIASAHQAFETRKIEQGWITFDPAEVWYKAKHVIAACLDIGHVQAHELVALALVTRGDQLVAWSITDDDTNSVGVAFNDADTNLVQVPLLFDWLIEHFANTQATTPPNQVLSGTLDTWLVWNLSGKYVASRSTAQCTGLMNMSTGQWDATLLTRYHIPPHFLPPLCDMQDTECFGRARARGSLADELPIAAVVSHLDALAFALRHPANKADTQRDQSDAVINGTALIAAESFSFGSALVV